MNEKKEILLTALNEAKVFWSYDHIDSISDEDIIENVLLYLDIEQIDMLFSLYSFSDIKKVWESRLIIQEPYFSGLNRILALLYFNINDPDVYIKEKVNEYETSMFR